jgi:hypothetical protein
MIAQETEKIASIDETCTSGGGYPLPDTLPLGFRSFVKSTLNASQQAAISASATEYGDGGFTLIKGPPGKFMILIVD